MRQRTIIILVSISIAFIFMTGGYGLWEKKLVVRTDIDVIAPIEPPIVKEVVDGNLIEEIEVPTPSSEQVEKTPEITDEEKTEVEASSDAIVGEITKDIINPEENIILNKVENSTEAIPEVTDEVVQEESNLEEIKIEVVEETVSDSPEAIGVKPK